MHTVPRVQTPSDYPGVCLGRAFLYTTYVNSPHPSAQRRRPPDRPNSHIRDGMRLQDVSVRPFEDVVAEYGPMVLRVCRAVLGPVDADDAWSETFISAMRAYPTLDPSANVEAWLVTIAHRRAIDVGRG